QAQVRPVLATVGRLVDAVTNGQVGSDDPGPGPDVDDVGIARRDGDRTDRASGGLVEERFPIGTVVCRSPHTAVVEPDVEHVRLAWHAGPRPRPAGPRGAYRSPVHPGVDIRGL